MKKTILTLTCIAVALIMTACGGNKKDKDGKIDTMEIAEKLIEKEFSGEKRSKAAAEHYLKNFAGIDLATILPDYDYNCEPERNCFSGEERKVVAGFFKTEGEVTKEEFKAFVAKVYEATQKASEDGKNIYGFEKRNDKDEAMSEVALEQLFADGDEGWIYLGMYDWGYRHNGKLLHVYTNMSSTSGEQKRWYASVDIAPALEKSFEETMKDAEKALESEDVQKAIKDYLK